jgi:hypothetical protein
MTGFASLWVAKSRSVLRQRSPNQVFLARWTDSDLGPVQAYRIMNIYYFGFMRDRILFFAIITVTVGDFIYASDISSSKKAKFDEVGVMKI